MLDLSCLAVIHDTKWFPFSLSLGTADLKCAIAQLQIEPPQTCGLSRTGGKGNKNARLSNMYFLRNYYVTRVNAVNAGYT